MYFYFLLYEDQTIPVTTKGNHAFADLRYGEEDTISYSTLIYPATKG